MPDGFSDAWGVLEELKELRIWKMEKSKRKEGGKCIVNAAVLTLRSIKKDSRCYDFTPKSIWNTQYPNLSLSDHWHPH